MAAKRLSADETRFERYDEVLWRKCSAREKKKRPQNKRLFYETDRVTIPLVGDLSPSLTTTTDSSPDGLSALNKDR